MVYCFLDLKSTETNVEFMCTYNIVLSCGQHINNRVADGSRFLDGDVVSGIVGEYRKCVACHRDEYGGRHSVGLWETIISNADGTLKHKYNKVLLIYKHTETELCNHFYLMWMAETDDLKQFCVQQLVMVCKY